MEGNLCFYMSDHGFGHIARNLSIIAEAARKTRGQIYLVCGEKHLAFARENLLGMLTPAQMERIHCRAEQTDVGLILQPGTLLVDVPALTRACTRYLECLPQRAAREAEWLSAHRIGAALCDMPLWSISASQQAEVPLLYLGNFTWTELYREFLPAPIWEAYGAQYGKNPPRNAVCPAQSRNAGIPFRG